MLYYLDIAGVCIMKRMSGFSFFAFFIMALAISLPAMAQLENYEPQVGVDGYDDISGPREVATIYHRLIGKEPDFVNWARLSPEFKTLNSFDQVKFMEDKPRELEDEFKLMGTDQPIIVQFKAVLSNYSAENGGYVVRNFDEEMFFPYSFAGRNYAVIPRGLMDYQFLPVTDYAQKNVEQVLKTNKRNILMVIYLTPNYASKDDDKKPVQLTLPGETVPKPYTLISGKIGVIKLYSCPRNQNCKSLWESGTAEYREEEKNELLKLKQ